MVIDGIKKYLRSFSKAFKIKPDPRNLRVERGWIIDKGVTINFIRKDLVNFTISSSKNLNFCIFLRDDSGNISSIINNKKGSTGRLILRVDPGGDCVIYDDWKRITLGDISKKWEGLTIKKIKLNKYGAVTLECGAIHPEDIIKELEWVKIKQ